MSRYTRKSLETDLIELNQSAKTVRGSNTHLKVLARNGYTGVDEFDDATGTCIRNIQCGTPIECYNAAVLWSRP